MSQLLETIKCKDGVLYNMEFHQVRFEKARKDFFACDEKINLAEIIQIPDEFKTGLFRCRVLYSKTIEKVEFLPHKYRSIKSLKLIEANNIDYSFKYSDRNYLNELFEKRGNYDDILIVKNDFITDSFTANPVFFDGKKWWTPNTPLLKGTQRARLIQQGKIYECAIQINDISKYIKVGLINALQDLNEMPIISTENIG